MSDTPTMDDAVEAQHDTDTRPQDEAVQPARLNKLGNAAALPSGSDVGLDLILDVSVKVSLELGSTTLTIRDLLQLNQGSIVEFERRVGEPLDLLVNGTLLAHGELVVVDDRFGIRLTDVVSPAQRLEKLN